MAWGNRHYKFYGIKLHSDLLLYAFNYYINLPLSPVFKLYFFFQSSFSQRNCIFVFVYFLFSLLLQLRFFLYFRFFDFLIEAEISEISLACTLNRKTCSFRIAINTNKYKCSVNFNLYRLQVAVKSQKKPSLKYQYNCNSWLVCWS